jgi:hypothetical protein
MGSIFIALLVIAALVWLWRDSLAASELAIQVCRASCESEGTQFLDDTVALDSIRAAFPQGRPALRRVYQFEFSRQGNDRQYGTIILTGTHLHTLYIPGPADTQALDHPQGGVVIDLEDIERRRHE